MDCFVYKGNRKADCYLYLSEADKFDHVPKALLEQLGDLQQVLNFDLHPDRTLAQENAASVLESLQNQGYHLQMPPPVEPPH